MWCSEATPEQKLMNLTKIIGFYILLSQKERQMVETIKLPLKLKTNIVNLFSPREFTVDLNVNE